MFQAAAEAEKGRVHLKKKRPVRLDKRMWGNSQSIRLVKHVETTLYGPRGLC